jgi:hypothetical protein
MKRDGFAVLGADVAHLNLEEEVRHEGLDVENPSLEGRKGG